MKIGCVLLLAIAVLPLVYSFIAIRYGQQKLLLYAKTSHYASLVSNSACYESKTKTFSHNQEDAVQEHAAEIIEKISDLKEISLNNVGVAESGGTRERIDLVINNNVQKNPKISLVSIKWVADRCEVVVSAAESTDENPIDLTTEDIQGLQKNITDAIESDSVMNTYMQNIEMLVATPGISDVLRQNRDFVTFRGFQVKVTLSQEWKKKTIYEGSLMGRDQEYVTLSKKGKSIKIPRELVQEVRLPPSKFESDDHEIRKLR